MVSHEYFDMRIITFQNVVDIENLVKPESSYNQGMKPLIYSKKDAESGEGQGIGWYRDGQNICYFQNSLKKKAGGFYYTLTF